VLLLIISLLTACDPPVIKDNSNINNSIINIVGTWKGTFHNQDFIIYMEQIDNFLNGKLFRASDTVNKKTKSSQIKGEIIGKMLTFDITVGQWHIGRVQALLSEDLTQMNGMIVSNDGKSSNFKFNKVSS
jgi:hypothetical protein